MRSILKSMLSACLVLIAIGPLSAGTTDAADEMELGTITLDSISRLYEEVDFDHDMHVELAESCSSCHHHAAGTPAEPECASCHQTPKNDDAACRTCHAAEPFSAEFLRAKEADRERYHIDKPGLKAAYHWNCMGCHDRMGGPMGCGDCHARNEAGDAVYRAGAYAPKVVQNPDHAH